MIPGKNSHHEDSRVGLPRARWSTGFSLRPPKHSATTIYARGLAPRSGCDHVVRANSVGPVPIESSSPLPQFPPEITHGHLGTRGGNSCDGAGRCLSELAERQHHFGIHATTRQQEFSNTPLRRAIPFGAAAAETGGLAGSPRTAGPDRPLHTWCGTAYLFAVLERKRS